MSVSAKRTAVIATLAFAGGMVVTNLPSAFVAAPAVPDVSATTFAVFADEVKQNFVFGDEFIGAYTTTGTLMLKVLDLDTLRATRRAPVLTVIKRC